MAYICKNCGKIITDEEFENCKKPKNKIMGIGCFWWIIIFLFFISVVLIPIALLLLLIGNRQSPENVCPYCQSKDSLIPDNTPIANNIINQYYSEDDIKNLHQKQQAEEVKPPKKLGLIIGITAMIMYIYYLITTAFK